jgi:hypothetical protein
MHSEPLNGNYTQHNINILISFLCIYNFIYMYMNIQFTDILKDEADHSILYSRKHITNIKCQVLGQSWTRHKKYSVTLYYCILSSNNRLIITFSFLPKLGLQNIQEQHLTVTNTLFVS